MLTILSDPTKARCILRCLRSQSLEICKTPTTRFNGRELNSLWSNGRELICLPAWSNINLQLTLLKTLQFSGPSLPGMSSSTLQSNFLSGVLLWQWWLSYPLRASVNCTNWLYTWTLNPNSSKPNKTEWWNIINREWLI